MSTPLRARRDGGSPVEALTPPHSVEAEQSLLGALLIDGTAWDQIGDIVHAEDFYRPDHRMIFEAVAALVAAGRPADVVTVSEHLERHGQAERCRRSRLSGHARERDAHGGQRPHLCAHRARAGAAAPADRGRAPDRLVGLQRGRSARRATWSIRPSSWYSRSPSRARAAAKGPCASAPCCRS